MTSLLDADICRLALQQKTPPFEALEESGQTAAATRGGMPGDIASRYPYLLEVVGELAAAGYDLAAEFGTGLDMLLDGLDALRASLRRR